MNAFKKFFALILSLCMVLSYVPVRAFAAETGGEVAVSDGQPLENQDIFVLGNDNTQGEVRVDHSAGVLRAESQVANVDGMTEPYVAYDIDLYTADGSYSGAATVSLPLGTVFAADAKLRGFVVNGDGSVTYIDEVTRNTDLNTLTFAVSNIGVVGVTLAEEDEDRITVYVGQTITFTDNTGNYSDATGLDNAYVDVSVEGFDSYTDYPIASDPTANTVKANGIYVIYLHGSKNALTNQQGSGDWGTHTLATAACGGEAKAETMWILEPSGDGYKLKNGDKYAIVSRNTANLNDTGHVFSLTYTNDGWTIKSNDTNEYFNNLNNSGSLGGWEGDGTKFDLYEVSTVNVPAVSYIAFTGKTEGKTSVDIGDTTYNLNVIQKVEKVTLQAGDSTVIRDNSGSYTAGNVADPSVASVTANGTALHNNYRVGSAVNANSFRSGKQYLLVNVRGNWMVSNQAGSNSKLAVNSTPGIASSDPENYFWTITKHSDGVYTIQDVNGKYLTFGDPSGGRGTSSISDTRVNLNVYYNSLGNWVIRNDNSDTIYLNDRNGQPGGWVTSGQDTEVGNQWRLVEAMYDDASYTNVTINGLTPGTTSVMVGYTRYDITVVGDEPELDPVTVNVNLKVGETKKETIADVAYTMDNVTTSPDSTIANLDSVVANRNGGEKRPVEITSLNQIVSGKQYLLYNLRRSMPMVNTTGDNVVSNGETLTGLSLGGTLDSYADGAIWTLTVVSDGVYTIQDMNGKYLNIEHNKLSLQDDPCHIAASYSTSGDNSPYWTFNQDGAYLCHAGESAATASGWRNDNASTDSGCKWRVYEIVTDPIDYSTDVTFTGVKAGTTTATVGHVTYNITVEKNITEIRVNLEVGQSAHYTDKTGNYQADVTRADNFDAVATLEVTGTALSNVLGSEVTAQDDLTTGTYILYNVSNGKTLTNVPFSSRLELTGALSSITNAAIWTITKTGDGTYTIRDAAGQYLHFGSDTGMLTADERELHVTWTDGHWLIKNEASNCYLNHHSNSNTAGGWFNPASDKMSNTALHWKLYKVNTTGQTGVTIGAKAVGTTSVVVGNTRYVITVGERKLTQVDVTLEQFESVTLTDKTGDYTNNYTTAEDFDTYAGLELSKTQTMKVNSVSADKTTNTLETGTYIIVNNRANKTMTNQSASEGAEAGTMAGMKLNGTKDAVTGKAVWTITKNDDGTYYVQDASGKYLTIASNSAGLVTESHKITIVYEGGNWRLSENGAYLNDAGNKATTAAGWQHTDAAGDAGSQWSIYSVDATPVITTSITITGKEVGTTSVVVGNTQYNVTVTPDYFEEITGKGKFVGQSNNEVDVDGKPVNKLTLSPGNSFSLGVDTKTADSVVWEIGDASIATVDENGTVTGVGPGDTTVKATVTVAGVSNTIEIPVHITADFGTRDGDGNSVLAFFYVDEVVNTDVYYAMYIDGVASEVLNDKVEEGHVISILRPTNTGFGVVWLSSPHDGYALTYMQSTGSAGQYYPLHEGDDELELTDENYYASGSANNYHGGFGGMVANSGKTAEELRTMLRSAITQYSVDGAMSQSRGQRDNEKLVTGLSFAADKLPYMTKNVQGVMGTSGLYADWKVYHPNMYAKVGEVIFFELVVTLEVPHTWADEDETIAAVNIENADIIDKALAGAYFYTKDDDYDPNTAAVGADPSNPYYGLDGQLPAGLQKTTQDDIHTQLNAAWTEAEKAAGQRVLTYYVVYKIPSDADPTQITNTATLNMQYKSKYSEGSSNAVSDADASIYLLGESLGDILLDFGMPVTIDGLTESDLANQFDEAMTNSADQGCKYGSVKISEYTENGKTYWAVTYTPHTVFTGYDVVYLRDANGTLKNYFRVYPASTIHYEENFAEFGTANDPANTGLPAVSWTFEKNGVKMGLANGKPAVPQGTAYIDGELEYLYVGCSDPTHLHSNFGYTEKYVADTETGMSNRSQAISKHSGDTATFTFTGTGLDVYANIDENTSIVSVMLYELNGDEEKLVKFYQVMTADTAGNADDSLPVVSVTDLKHGTYKAVIRHTKQMSDVTKEFRLDGFRIYNTMESTEVYYPMDEQNAVFVDLRDEVLSGLTGLDTSTSVSQVFSQSSKLGDVIYTTTTSNTDLLDHSPKNEIWLSGTESLTFKVGDAVGYAQIGLKAPRGEVTAKITTSLYGNSVVQTYVIKTATDMFYRLPDGLNGATVTIQVESGAMLSVTKLKAVAGSNIAVGSFEALGVMNEVELASVLDIVLDRNTGLDNDIVGSNVTRIYGDNRFETAFKVANELKTVLGVEKFESIIIASGTNFADALSGSYLATVKNAPILLSYDATYDQMVRDYIAANLAENGTVYILGGEAAVAACMDDALVASGVTVKRLAGANRFDTNLAILAEAGVENQEILICTGTNFADSLSASATGMPIMLVYNESGKLTDEQAKYLAQLNGCTFTVIGGEKAVSAELAAAIGTYGAVQRLAGEDRFQTSVAIAQRYFRLPDSVVMAYAGNYPDGLCGGVLANALKAPLILTMNGYEAHARKYVFNTKVEGGLILGGAGLISDDSVVNMFNLSNALEIIVK